MRDRKRRLAERIDSGRLQVATRFELRRREVAETGQAWRDAARPGSRSDEFGGGKGRHVGNPLRFLTGVDIRVANPVPPAWEDDRPIRKGREDPVSDPGVMGEGRGR